MNSAPDSAPDSSSAEAVRRSLFIIHTDDGHSDDGHGADRHSDDGRSAPGRQGVRVDILVGGQVRLRHWHAAGTHDILCDTLEEMALIAAASDLPTDLYEPLIWELDLLGLRGE